MTKKIINNFYSSKIYFYLLHWFVKIFIVNLYHKTIFWLKSLRYGNCLQSTYFLGLNVFKILASSSVILNILYISNRESNLIALGRLRWLARHCTQ